MTAGTRSPSPDPTAHASALPATGFTFAELQPDAIAARIVTALTREVQATQAQIDAAITLLDEGATVPFIARYRKEVTGGLDDTQLRTLEERLRYRREMEERRAVVLRSIAQQDKLSEALRGQLLQADTLARIEDLYAPYKPKRRTRAMIAREAGLQPLADLLRNDPTRDPQTEALPYVGARPESEPGKESPFGDVKAVLNGARDILAEEFSEDADLVARLRAMIADEGIVQATLVEGKAQEAAKFADYFDHHERLAKVPSHRALAMFRGRTEGFLRLEIRLGDEPGAATAPAATTTSSSAPGALGSGEAAIAAHFRIRDQGRAADRWLLDVVRWTWRTRLLVQLQLDAFSALRERAELEAINVFGANLKDLLLAAPAGPRAAIGLDPGLRTGVKLAVIDTTGKVLGTDTIFPHAPRNDWDGSIMKLARLCATHGVGLAAIGNGTASRETEQLVRDLCKRHPELGVTPVVVSEAGASVYSASELAAREFPDLDVSLRGAVSIARRLQDPLAELVKIDPKSIGVGQYQHDVNQHQLARALDTVVEDCVNGVGVDLNTASVPLLARVSGLSAGVAQSIVSYRDANGAFASRAALKKVPRLGERTFEQCAAFLRIMNAQDPLDASAVHPEAYGVVQKMLARLRLDARELIGNKAALAQLQPAEFTDERFGVPTVSDILKELEKPGRDPRPEFKTARFTEGVSELQHLKVGMTLEGVVTNVTAFGAFIDIGVHQDGLAHVSELADRFVKDPRDAVKTGQVVQARVLEVDLARKRIALSLRKQAADGARTHERGKPPERTGSGNRHGGRDRGQDGNPARSPARGAAPMPANNALADALARARKKAG